MPAPSTRPDVDRKLQQQQLQQRRDEQDLARSLQELGKLTQGLQQGVRTLENDERQLLRLPVGGEAQGARRQQDQLQRLLQDAQKLQTTLQQHQAQLQRWVQGRQQGKQLQDAAKQK